MQTTMAFKLDRDRVRLVLVQGGRELLRASLPPPAQFWSAQPVKALLEGLATWLDTSLRVVFAAADRQWVVSGAHRRARGRLSHGVLRGRAGPRARAPPAAARRR